MAVSDAELIAEWDRESAIQDATFQKRARRLRLFFGLAMWAYPLVLLWEALIEC